MQELTAVCVFTRVDDEPHGETVRCEGCERPYCEKHGKTVNGAEGTGRMRQCADCLRESGRRR